MFDLFYSEAGYKAIDGQTIDQFASRYGYFIVDKSDKTICFTETLVRSIYQGKEYMLGDVIESGENETMSNTEKLLPCPFCGGEAELHIKKGFNGEIVFVFVGCNNCQSSTRTYSTETGAVEAWNKRAL